MVHSSQSYPDISPSSSRSSDSMLQSSSVAASQSMPPPPPRKSSTNLAALVTAEGKVKADKVANGDTNINRMNQDDNVSSVTRLHDLTSAMERNVPNMVPNEAPPCTDQKQQKQSRQQQPLDLKHTSLRRPSLDGNDKHLSNINRKAHTGKGLFKKRLFDAAGIIGGLSSNSKKRKSSSCPSLSKSCS